MINLQAIMPSETGGYGVFSLLRMEGEFGIEEVGALWWIRQYYGDAILEDIEKLFPNAMFVDYTIKQNTYGVRFKTEQLETPQ